MFCGSMRSPHTRATQADLTMPYQVPTLKNTQRGAPRFICGCLAQRKPRLNRQHFPTTPKAFVYPTNVIEIQQSVSVHGIPLVRYKNRECRYSPPSTHRIARRPEYQGMKCRHLEGTCTIRSRHNTAKMPRSSLQLFPSVPLPVSIWPTRRANEEDENTCAQQILQPSRPVGA